METIELAVERMRRPLKADGTARSAPPPPPANAPGMASSGAPDTTAVPPRAAASPRVPAPHAFKAQLAEAQLPIKTRVLCEYSPDVQAIVTGQTARAPQAVHVPFAIIASVIAGMVGAVGMATAMWYSGQSSNPSQAPGPMAQAAPVAAPAVATGSPAAPAAAPVAPAASRPVVPAPPAETAGPVASVAAPAATSALASAATAAPDPAPARELVDAWAKAWSARDADRYLGFYAAGFVPDKGVARATWESGRRKRLAAQKVIQVAVRDVQVDMQGADRATVRFVQDYSADTYREVATPKKLLLVREAGGWRIAAEAAG